MTSTSSAGRKKETVMATSPRKGKILYSEQFFE
jgi:hypothetical protein